MMPDDYKRKKELTKNRLFPDLVWQPIHLKSFDSLMSTPNPEKDFGMLYPMDPGLLKAILC